MYELFPPKADKTYVPPKDLKYRKFHKGFKDYLRSHLKIYPKYVEMAQETFRKVAKKMKISPEKVTYVGMHHRQTGKLLGIFSKTLLAAKHLHMIQPQISCFFIFFCRFC